MANERVAGLKRHLLNREKAFILVNSGADLVKLPWGGETIVCPPANKITPPHPKFSDVRHSAIVDVRTGKDLEQRLIPGTLVVRDIIETGELDEIDRRWDAAQFILSLVGEQFEGPYGQRGVSWAPIDATIDELTVLAIEGRARWEESRIKDAQLTVWEQGQKDSRWISAGLSPEPPKAYVRDAQAFLAVMAEKRGKLMADMLMAGDPYARTMIAVTGREETLADSYGGVKVGASLLPQEPPPTAPETKPAAPGKVN